MSDEKPPPLPWRKGSKDYSAFVIEVHVCERARHVFSVHRFQTSEDEAAARQLPSMGEEQTAYALLTEALRREAYVQALIRLQQEGGFLEAYRAADEDLREEMEAKLAKGVSGLAARTSEKMAPDIVREILKMLSQQ